MSPTLARTAVRLFLMSLVPLCTAAGQAVDTDSLRRASRAQAEATARRVAEAAAVFVDRRQAAERRLAAVTGIGAFDRPEHVAAATVVAFDRSEPTAVRVRAVQLTAARAAVDDSLRGRLIDLVMAEATPPELRRAAMEELEAAHFTWHPGHPRADQVLAALRRLARDPDPAIRRSALRMLAAHGDAEALQLLERGLLSPAEALLPPTEAVLLLGLRNPSRHYQVLRRVLVRPPDAPTRIVAIRLLAGDSASREPITRILVDASEGLDARQAALGALASGDPQGLPARVLPLVRDEAAPRDLRVRAIKTVEVHRTSRDGEAIRARTLDDFDREVARLASEERDATVRAAAVNYVRRTGSPQ